MILPERVFGKPGAHWMTSGVAIPRLGLPPRVDDRAAAVDHVVIPFPRFGDARWATICVIVAALTVVPIVAPLMIVSSPARRS